MMKRWDGSERKKNGSPCFHRRRCSHVCGPWKSAKRRTGRRASYASGGWDLNLWPGER